jgi:hypothetical protein
MGKSWYRITLIYILKLKLQIRIISWVDLIFISLLFTQCHKYKNPRRDTSKYIQWQKNINLNWTDFKGIRPWGDPHAAGSYLWFDIDNKEIQDSIEIHLTTFIIPDSSWFNPAKINNRVLIHERRHFDLGEVFNRKFRKYLTNWNGKSFEDFDAYFSLGNFKQEAQALQSKYDSETNHSLNILQQEAWNHKIDSLLEDYKNFSDPVIRIRINRLNHYRGHKPN